MGLFNFFSKKNKEEVVSQEVETIEDAEIVEENIDEVIVKMDYLEDTVEETEVIEETVEENNDDDVYGELYEIPMRFLGLDKSKYNEENSNIEFSIKEGMLQAESNLPLRRSEPNDLVVNDKIVRREFVVTNLTNSATVIMDESDFVKIVG